MRGLPFRVTENDISEWFSSVVDPVSIDIQFNNQGRPTGEADVYFEKYVFYKCFLNIVVYFSCTLKFAKKCKQLEVLSESYCLPYRLKKNDFSI